MKTQTKNQRIATSRWERLLTSKTKSMRSSSRYSGSEMLSVSWWYRKRRALGLKRPLSSKLILFHPTSTQPSLVWSGLPGSKCRISICRENCRSSACKTTCRWKRNYFRKGAYLSSISQRSLVKVVSRHLMWIRLSSTSGDSHLSLRNRADRLMFLI